MPLGWFVITPPSVGLIATVGKKLTAAMTGIVPTGGAIASTGKKATFASTGTHPYSGTIAAIVNKAIATFSGNQMIPGTIAAAYKKQVFDGSQAPEGTIAVTGKKSTFASAGNQPFTATVATQWSGHPVVAMQGEQVLPGIFAAQVKKAAFASAGTHEQTGTIDTAYKKAVFSGINLVPVTFGAVGAGNSGLGTSRTELHTIGSGLNRAILAFINTHSGNAARPAITMTCGGEVMTELGSITYYNPAPDYETLTVFGLLNPNSGSQSIVATIGASVQAALNSVSYDNVSGFGPVVTNFAVSTSAALSVPSLAGQMVSMAFSDYITAFSAFNKTSRWNLGWINGANVSIMIGDAAGDPALSFSATGGNAFGAIGVPLLTGVQVPPQPVTRIYPQAIVRSSTR